jgi:hypothetical protein
MIDPVFINLDYAGARRGRSRRIAAGGDATLMLKRYGEKALEQSATRADERLTAITTARRPGAA